MTGSHVPVWCVRQYSEFEYARVMRLVALAMATSLGVGYVPVAPGTFGSLVGLVLWALLPTAPVPQLVAIAVLCVGGAWSAGECERHFGGTDPSQVVIDDPNSGNSEGVMTPWAAIGVAPSLAAARSVSDEGAPRSG